jgi:hypothetical protein
MMSNRMRSGKPEKKAHAQANHLPTIARAGADGKMKKWKCKYESRLTIVL